VAKASDMDVISNPHLMTVADAAEVLAVSERTIWRYLKSGRLSGETIGEPGSQRTLIPREGVVELAHNRSGGDLAGVRAERDRLARRLADAQAERDALRGRVAALQSALARAGRPARLERLLGGAIAAAARVRVG
jgi:excisionase family DNA binding protein